MHFYNYKMYKYHHAYPFDETTRLYLISVMKHILKTFLVNKLFGTIWKMFYYMLTELY